MRKSTLFESQPAQCPPSRRPRMNFVRTPLFILATATALFAVQTGAQAPAPQSPSKSAAATPPPGTNSKSPAAAASKPSPPAAKKHTTTAQKPSPAHAKRAVRTAARPPATAAAKSDTAANSKSTTPMSARTEEAAKSKTTAPAGAQPSVPEVKASSSAQTSKPPVPAASKPAAIKVGKQAHRHKHPTKEDLLAAKAAATPAPVVAPPPPEPPHWPVNEKPAEAYVRWDSSSLLIAAQNSSLKQILDQIAEATGAKVEGMGADQRIFGAYGPGKARDVLTLLLDGTGYNVLLIGDQGEGTPRQIVLTTRGTGSATAQAAANATPPPPAAEEEPEPNDEPPAEELGARRLGNRHGNNPNDPDGPPHP